MFLDVGATLRCGLRGSVLGRVFALEKRWAVGRSLFPSLGLLGGRRRDWKDEAAATWKRYTVGLSQTAGLGFGLLPLFCDLSRRESANF